MTASAADLLPGWRPGPGSPPLLIAGPCVLEGEASLDHAEAIAAALAGLEVHWVFKASFDKANRTSLTAGRGPGLAAGLELLARIRERLGVPVLTDVHLPEQCAPAAEVCDVLQIPAFLCRQTDLLVAAAATGRAVNLKKGQFLAPADAAHAVGKLTAGGNRRVLLTERGACFGYGRLVVDFAALPELRRAGCPLILDATHSVQQPGSGEGRTGGDWTRAPILLRAGAAAGFDGFFVETHPDPLSSPSDGPNMIPLGELRRALEPALAVRAALSPPGPRSAP
ncbi:MAG: 3-deoxy-8-phosphooctulonate synthase [Planctomycetota bacterium]|nr:MAG: 3-deoxy-8-phosphooctulonate synthase [Planctomycetota bacterium]